MSSTETAILRRSRATGTSAKLLIKRAFDVIAASVALALLAPVFLLLIRLIKRDGGAAFYAQRRIGLNGREFRCFKFRTMIPNAESHLKHLLASDPALRAEYETFWKLSDDPRVTGIGRFLRRYSLDELPQFINVLAGDMSIVGPRPRSVAETAFMNAQFKEAAAYVNVKPGLTGPWQVSGRNDLSLEIKSALDADYSTSWTMLGDARLILATIRVVLAGQGAG